jgi:hypothetical protein
MNDMSSLFIATTILALGGLGLFMLKPNNFDESNESNETDTHLEENNTNYNAEENIDNDFDWLDSDKEVKNTKNTRTRRNKKKQRASRRRM